MSGANKINYPKSQFFCYLEEKVQGESNSGNGSSVKINIKAFVHVHSLAVTQVGMGNLVADILADAESNISKRSGQDEIENQFNPVVDRKESDFLDVVLQSHYN